MVGSIEKMLAVNKFNHLMKRAVMNYVVNVIICVSFAIAQLLSHVVF